MVVSAKFGNAISVIAYHQTSYLKRLCHSFVFAVVIASDGNESLTCIGGGRGGAIELQPHLISECSIGF